MIGTGYSLWLVEDHKTESCQSLQSLIFTLSGIHETPAFIPHITLVADINSNEKELVRLMHQFVQSLQPFRVQLTNLGSNGIYFQILFAIVKQTPELMSANIAAKRLFGTEKGIYVPHLSLAYGNLSLDQIATLIEKVRRHQPFVEGTELTLRNIELWRTIGVVQEWELVKVFSIENTL